ncbi:S-adenosyl-L-methionine-dependent methyltransferase [Xylaria bambusicola]|uniref:S-adenosyl-L-methionine-dependent methyltransferase n=1 Tax=Xylaria bambusicola TaxID=326684 RepID=UPI002007FE48|nr:S-adenosyl-L-methionine-dependent methyltransferase [Xylaria bambusicola]KAI0513195.1 S-adenosyl-L-methionine-dependent methyltransferase [Xylaria bambusicola]
MATPNVGPVTQLLTQVQRSTVKYLEYFSMHSLPEPSYKDGDGLGPNQQLPSDIEAARNSALEATEELHQLLLGPLGLILSSPGDQYLMLSIQYICRYNIAELVPLQEGTTFQAIATGAGLNLKDVTRFLRLSAAWHVFHEPARDKVVHTAASRLLINNPKLKAWIDNIAEEFWPSLARTVDATQRWPGSEEPNESGYSLGHNTDDSPFEVIKRDPLRQQRFMDVQSFSHSHHSFSIDHLLDGFDFNSVRTIVDVGGAHGKAAIALAQKYPHIEIIVQDQPQVIKGLKQHVPVDLEGRIRGMEHDFFTPQPSKDADVYLLRWVMHDWSDKYCIKILESLTPALKGGAKVVVSDICIPEPGQLSVAADRGFRQMDISMKAFNNARERDAETWAMLFERADPRYEFLGITIPQGARMAIIQAQWRGGDR